MPRDDQASKGVTILVKVVDSDHQSGGGRVVVTQRGRGEFAPHPGDLCQCLLVLPWQILMIDKHSPYNPGSAGQEGAEAWGSGISVYSTRWPSVLAEVLAESEGNTGG